MIEWFLVFWMIRRKSIIFRQNITKYEGNKKSSDVQHDRVLLYDNIKKGCLR